MKNLINPFIIYIMSFSFVLLAYSLNWSTLQPKLSYELLYFLSFSAFVSLVLGRITKKEISYSMELHFIDDKKPIRTKSKLLFIIIIIGLYAQFLYERSIPLFQIINNNHDGYLSFGIPVISLFALSAGTVFSTVFYDLYLQSKNKWFLFYSLVILFSFLLMLNRGAILIALVQMLIVYMIRRKPRFKFILSLITLSLTVLFLFGWVGNLRENHSDNKVGTINSDYIISLGGASQEFIENPIPNELFWGYLYLTTPIANFQNNITHNVCNSTTYDFTDLIVNELFPDFISKRINSYYSQEKVSNIRVSTAFTVGTIYGKSYIYSCWSGVYLLLLWFFLIIYAFLKLSYIRSQTVVAIAVIGTFSFFSIFTNVVAYSAISLQLFWALMVQRFYKF